MRKSQLSILGILKVIFDRPLYVLGDYVGIASELSFIQELGNAFKIYLHQVNVSAFLHLDDFPSQIVAVSCYFDCNLVLLRVRIAVHDTCGAAAYLGRVKVSAAIIGDLWHVRLLIMYSKYPLQFADRVSHFEYSSLPLCYGH